MLDHIDTLNNNYFKVMKNKISLTKESESFLLLAVAFYRLFIYLIHTTYKTQIKSETFTDFIELLAVVALARIICVIKESKDKRGTLVRMKPAAAVAAVYSIIFITHFVETKDFAGYSFLLAMAVLTIGTIGIEYHKIIRIAVCTGVMAIATAVFSSWAGIIPNIVTMKDWHMRSAWGIVYCTDFAAYIVFLAIFAWIGFKDKPGKTFFIPGAISFIISWFVARSYASSICSILLILAIIIDWLINNNKAKRLKKLIDNYLFLAFPAFFIVTMILLAAYIKGYGFAIRLNDLLSTRLALEAKAYEQYGLSLFGKAFEQGGIGGNTYGVLDYSFIDSTYCMLLLRYGIASVVVVGTIWVLMSRKAIKSNDYRLALAMAIIAFDAIVEQRFIEIENNILLLIPFSVLLADTAASSYRNCSYIKNRWEKTLYRIIIYTSAMIIICRLTPEIITILRTVTTIKGTAKINNQLQTAILSFIITSLIIIAFYYVIHLIEDLLSKRKVHKTHIIFVAAVTLGVFTGLWQCNTVINGYIDQTKGMHLESAKLISDLQNVDDCDFLVCRLPEVYDRMCGGIKKSIWNDEELTKFDKAVILTDSDEDYYQFFSYGFTYTELPGGEAIYTNNPAIIEYLDNNNYRVSGYYSKTGIVSLQECAGLAGIPLQDDWSPLELHEGQQLIGPYVGLRAGTYTVYYEIQVDNKALKHKDGQDEICSLQVTTFGGKKEVGGRSVVAEDFNRKGNCMAEVRFDLSNNSPNVEFRLLPTGVSTIKISSVSYMKTPDYDIRFTLDKKHRRNYEEYYDLEGNRLNLDVGYAARRLGYDDKGNINHEIYYDKHHRKVLNKSGYCEVKREYNNNKQIVRSEYYDTDGKLCLRREGYAITTISYNEKGEIIQQKYFDTKGNEINV